jgi:hypothetical protein
MKTVKFTTNANCLGQYEEAILAKGQVKTAIGLKRLVSKMENSIFEYRKYSPNYPVFMFIDDVEVASTDKYNLLLALSTDKALSDNNAIERFLNK